MLAPKTLLAQAQEPANAPLEMAIVSNGAYFTLGAMTLLALQLWGLHLGNKLDRLLTLRNSLVGLPVC